MGFPTILSSSNQTNVAGGKLTLLALSDKNSPFTCGAVVHPAMIANGDGDSLSRPLAFYPSKDEPTEQVQYIRKCIDNKPFTALCNYHLYDTV